MSLASGMARLAFPVMQRLSNLTLCPLLVPLPGAGAAVLVVSAAVSCINKLHFYLYISTFM